jgi:lysophospholipase L1-like esterase
MQATHGFAVSFHARGRLMGCLMALALALSALVLAPAAANAAAPPTGGPIYMALGDSISFGYSAQKFNENYPTESPSRFEEGLVNFFNKTLNKTDKGITPVNLACPGETSNGLIGENPLLGGETSTEPPSPPGLYQGPGDWHPCAYKNADGFPLHAGYGVISQLEDAVGILTQNNPYTGKPNVVKAITLNIGNNDVLAVIPQCKQQVKEEFEKTGKSKYGGTPEAAVTGCLYTIVPNVTVPHVLKNIGQILGVLDAYYTGPIILIGAYNPLTFVSPGGISDLLAEGINTQFETAIKPSFPNVTVANPFPVFNKKKKGSAQEQASICMYTEECNPNVQVAGGTPTGMDGDVHPSLLGYKTLAKLIKKAWEANPAK